VARPEVNWARVCQETQTFTAPASPAEAVIFWRKKIGEDEEVRRAAQAVHRSSIIIARAVFEAAIRDHADLCELIKPEPVPSTQRSVEDDS
jgi:hypothetical protein